MVVNYDEELAEQQQERSDRDELVYKARKADRLTSKQLGRPKSFEQSGRDWLKGKLGVKSKPSGSQSAEALPAPPKPGELAPGGAPTPPPSAGAGAAETLPAPPKPGAPAPGGAPTPPPPKGQPAEKLPAPPKPGAPAPGGAPTPPPAGGVGSANAAESAGQAVGQGAKSATSAGAKAAGKQVGKEATKQVEKQIVKQAGKQLAKEGAKQAAKLSARSIVAIILGVSGIGAAIPTGGISLVLTIISLVDLSITLNKYLFKFLKKHWLLIAFLLFAMTFGVYGMIYIYYSTFFRFNPVGIVGKKIISVITTVSKAGKLILNPSDYNKITKGEVGAVTADLIGLIAENHENVVPSLTFSKDGKVVNDGSAFSIDSLDFIKCTDTSTKKPALILPIKLNPDFDWMSAVDSGSLAKPYLCAVDYYPQIGAVSIDPYSKKYGPGEFEIKNIASAGPQAAQQKSAQLISEIMTNNATLGDEGKKDLIPAEITVPQAFYEKNLKIGSDSFRQDMLDLNTGLRATKKKNVKITPNDTVEGIIINII